MDASQNSSREGEPDEASGRHAFGDLNRRQLLKAGGLGVGALLLPGFLSACGSSGSSTGGGSAPAENPELKKLLDNITSKQVIVANYGGVTEEARRSVFFNAFESRTGVQVIEADAGSLAVPMLLGEIPTKWDAVHGSVEEGVAATMYGKKKRPKTPRIAWEDLVEPASARSENFQSFLIAYVPGFLKGTFDGAQPATWADFFDLKKFPGKRAWPAEYFSGGYFEAALMADGVNPDELYPLDYERAVAKIKSVFDEFVIYSEYPQAQTFLTSKTASMSYAPNGLFHELEEKGIAMGVAFDAPGVTAINAFNILPEPPNEDAVLALAAFCNQPQMQAEFAAATGYGPLTTKGLKAVAKEVLPKIPNGPGHKLFAEDPIYNAKHLREREVATKEVFS